MEVHRRFAALHRGNRWLGTSQHIRVAGAKQAGDLCQSLCDEIDPASAHPAEPLPPPGPAPQRKQASTPRE